MKKVAVLLGGMSPEKDISLKTGSAVHNALINKGYTAVKINPANESWTKELNEFKPDLVFIALHGAGGEDGLMQGYLETLGYKHTGSGVLASSMAMNKIFTQKVLKEANIPIPNFLTLRKSDYEQISFQDMEKKILDQLKIPFVVKAPSQGSTIGIYFIHKKEDIQKAIENAFKYEEEIIIEAFVKGMELTVAVLGNSKPFALPTLEITTVTGVYDYETKYTPGMSDHIIPARLPEEINIKCRDLAEEVYKLLHIKGFGRVDMMLDENNNPYVIEINTIPGMTETSLIPDAAKYLGISFDDLVELICDMAYGAEFPEEFKDRK